MRRYSFAPNPSRFGSAKDQPMGEMNTTPLIDVLLVLIIMLIITIPVLTHNLKVPLPSTPPGHEIRASNTVSIDVRDTLYWNSNKVTRAQLYSQLYASAQRVPKPLIRFEPDANASYDQSAKTIALIKDSGIETFAFIGNHKYREFKSVD